MIRRAALAGAVLLLASACSADMGVRLPECEDVPRRPTTAVILSLQAVPTAEYAPCIDELKLGWDDVQFDVESGMAELTIRTTFEPFLTVTLTPSCAVTGAGPLPTDHPDISKYEDVRTRVGPTVRVVLIPTGQRPEVRAGAIARSYQDSALAGRIVEFSVDTDLDMVIRDRVARGLLEADFVWIIDELEAVENTVQVRRIAETELVKGVSPDEALDHMERWVEEPRYEGTWYYTFVGGCITYEFSAAGKVAETVEEDVASAIGFYDLDALRTLARRSGIDIEQPPPEG